MSKLYENDDSVIKIELYLAGREYKEYDVYLEEGNWPTEYDLVTIVDGGNPELPWEDQMHGGGIVIQGEQYNHRIVKLFSR